MKHFLIVLSFLSFLPLYSQTNTAKIEGVVSDTSGSRIPGVYIFLNDSLFLTTTDSNGKFVLVVPKENATSLTFRFTGYKKVRKEINLTSGNYFFIEVYLNVMEVSKVYIESSRLLEVGLNDTELNPIIPKYLPSAFGDFSKSIVGMALGVSSTNELSNQYSVRGGNFDENLIYVNDIEVYRPQLLQTGQQEGLSFVNPDLVQKATFNSGGWEAKYGDKLSSVLAVQYKTPQQFKGSLTAGLLGGSIHVESKLHQRLYWLSGARLKSSRYLLNTLDTKGEYLPLFWDWQNIFTLDLTSKYSIKNHPLRSNIELFSVINQNQYLVIPSNRKTTFGTLDNPLQIDIGFDGREDIRQHMIQQSIRWNKTWNNQVTSSLWGSYIYSVEREFYDVEAGYRISEVDPDPSTSGFNQNLITKGIGSYFDHGRNKMLVHNVQIGSKTSYTLSPRQKVEGGLKYHYENIQDLLDEYSFTDSSQYVTLTKSVYKENALINQRIQPYVQYSQVFDSTHFITIGIRGHYWSTSNEFLISPRIQYKYQPKNHPNVSYTMAMGAYHQPGYYRELRKLDGTLNTTSIKAQRSWQWVMGMKNKISWWDRTFYLTSEIYYKYMTNIIPYDLYDIRIRYYGENLGNAYAYGADVRLNGEFIKGLESWFNLGILSTKEDVTFDTKGYIRRPSDQRVTASIFFQDHIPNNPSLRVFLNLVFSSGLPFGPPNEPDMRSVLNAPPYRRVDIGFSKLIQFNNKSIEKNKAFESIWISAEILNLLGTSNTISYLWLPDYSSNYYAVPNTLSQRFLNIKLLLKW